MSTLRSHQVWGKDNREAPLRAAFSEDGKTVTNFELKAMDATANPYLAIAATIYAGLWGVTHATKLPDPVQVAFPAWPWTHGKYKKSRTP